MRGALCLAVLSAVFLPATAAVQGFDSWVFNDDGTPKYQADYEAEFKTARALVGAPAGGFTSVRLSTMIVSRPAAA